MSLENRRHDKVTSHRIADSLRSSILDGRILPGTRIRQEDVAAQFGGSRLPAREALRMLQADGLIVLVANSGAWVSKLTLEECSEAYQMGERLEPLLLRLSMKSISSETIDRLGELAAGLQRNTDVSTFMRLDREFHLQSYSGSSAHSLTDIIHRLWNTTQHYRRVYATLVSAERSEVTHMEHHLLVDSLRRRDQDDAERILVMHIRRTRLELEKHPDIFI